MIWCIWCIKIIILPPRQARDKHIDEKALFLLQWLSLYSDPVAAQPTRRAPRRALAQRPQHAA